MLDFNCNRILLDCGIDIEVKDLNGYSTTNSLLTSQQLCYRLTKTSTAWLLLPFQTKHKGGNHPCTPRDIDRDSMYENNLKTRPSPRASHRLEIHAYLAGWIFQT